MNLKKENVLQMVKKIYINLTDLEAEIILKQFETFCQNIEEMHKVETLDVDSMDYPIEVSNHFLREDLSEKDNEKKEVFSNCKNFSKKHVVIK